MLYNFRVLVCIAAILTASAMPASSEEQPVLMLDTGGHQALIGGVAFTQDGKYIVSASEDKVIRIWDWQQAKTIRTLRGETGPGPQGKIYAMALSADNRWLAVAGFMGAQDGDSKDIGAIRLYDFKTGTLKALLKGHDKEIIRLSFSPDSQLLASGGFDNAVIIWDAGEAKPLRRLEGHNATIRALDFTSDGQRIVSGGDDNQLLLWNVSDGVLLRTMVEHEDKIYALAASAADGVIASGDASGDIRLWDGQTGAFLRKLGRECNSAAALDFSPDGKLLLATCGYRAHTDYYERVFEVESGKAITVYTGHDDRARAGTFSPDGSLVVTGGGNDHSVRVWDPRTGDTKSVMKGTGRVVWGAAFSKDGTKISWGNTLSPEHPPRSHGPLETAMILPLNNPALGLFEKVSEENDWIRERYDVGGISLKHRKGGALGYDAILDILDNGNIVASIERTPLDGIIHSAYTLSSDGKQVISGGGLGFLAAYDPGGKKIGDFIGHEGDVWGAAVSPDNKYLVSGGGDQTVRLWSMETKKLIVSLFKGAPDEWVIWTPQGYYAGSPGADKIVGWQINKGAGEAAEYFTAEQLRNDLYRPDIVTKAIRLASAEEAIRTSFGTNLKIADLIAHPAPQLRIVASAAESAFQSSGSLVGSSAVRVALDQTPDPVTRFRIQVNGRQLDDLLPESGPSFAPGERDFKVPLAKGKNTIVVTALNAVGWSKAEDGTTVLTSESAGELDQRGTLYIVAIGVTKYPGIRAWCEPRPTCDLNYTGLDATAFADAIQRSLGPLHDKVVRRVLVNGGAVDDTPTAANIIDALGSIADAKPNDTVAVFLAGHGVNDGPNYRFISTDASGTGGKIRPSSVVPWHWIEETIDQAKGRRLLFIDTCHSAGAYNERLGNKAYYANILAYSSARWDQEALESAQFKHGLFTEALVEALSGKADTEHRGRVDTAQLNDYLQKRVPELAKLLKREQNPQFFKGRDAETYTLALP